ncbi:MAG: PLP-dependent aspartate aminotransferase family protein [Bacteroidales bacterium]|nr:PLP-dependent aspartate aminotransferase family protein [Bacteroidales bacterium]
MDKNTIALHTQFRHPDAYGAISMPVYHTAAYQFPDAASMTEAFSGRSGEPDYSRVMNPTVSFFEDKVRTLTGAKSVTAFNSGMAAISNLFLAVAEAGKNIVTSAHMFGNTFSLITKTLNRFGVEAKIVNLTDVEAVAAAVDDQTACIYLEIVTNPQLEVANLKALAEIAHSHNIPLLADTTFLPFTEFDGKKLGIDVRVVSSTKYLSGGATSLGGLIIDYGNFPNIEDRIKNELLFNVGAYMTPHAAYMQALGLETLHARYKIQSGNALELARRLSQLPQIQKVGYIGLEDNPYHDLAVEQFGPSGGAMITIDLLSEEVCYRFINNLKIIFRATNLFDNKTLAIHPYSTIFVGYSAEEKARMDVLPTTIRLSIGLEDVDDLFDDIRQALEAANI